MKLNYVPHSEKEPMKANHAHVHDVKEIIEKINKQTVIDETMINECSNIDELQGESIFSKIIYTVTRLHVPVDKAKQCWIEILNHLLELCNTLGRNVGVQIAACDYLSNINHQVKNPVFIEDNMLTHKEESAYKDGLTRLYNKQYFDQEMPAEIERFRRFGIPFSLLMLDLDHFKRFNDKFGHQAGDVALAVIADAVCQSARIYDKVVRYGGEEFAVILPQTSRTEASITAERIRSSVEEQPIVYEGRSLGSLTASIGVATYPIDALDMAGLVRRADQALYVAKRRRNAVVAFFDYNRRNPRLIQEQSLSA